MKTVCQLKTVSFLLVLIITSISAFSQQTNFGVKAGINSSSIEVQKGNDFGSKTGLHAGVLAHIHVGNTD